MEETSTEPIPENTDNGPPARRAVAEAVSRLLVEQPFYGYFLKTFDIKRSDAQTRTMAVGFRRGRINCIYNAKFVLSLTPKKLQAILIHEILHVVHLHLTRRENREPFVFNIACDMAINPKIESLPNSALSPPPEWHGANAEYIYDQLVEEVSQDLIKIGEGLLDDHDLWQEAEGREWEVENAVGQAVTDAHTKSHGNMPGEVRDAIDWWLARPQVSWRQMLRNFVHSHTPAHKEVTYSRRNRRHDIFGIPSKRRHHSPSIAVGVDTSGSVTEEGLNLFFSELEGLALEATPAILLFHTEVYTIRPYEKGDFKSMSIEWGGTDFLPVFDCLERGTSATDGTKLAHRVDCAIMLTDGWAEYPATSRLPVLWVFTPHHTEETPPFGRVTVLEDREIWKKGGNQCQLP